MIIQQTRLKYINKSIGYGVFAKTLIPKGTIIRVEDSLDKIYTPAQVSQMNLQLQDIIDEYSYRNKDGNYLLCWDNGRMMNHSFRANCFLTPYHFEIATEDILPGQELTNDYGVFNVEEPMYGTIEGTRRRNVYPDDLLKYHKIWDEKIRKAFFKINEVEQPLSFLIDIETQRQIQMIINKVEPMKSVLEMYCPFINQRFYQKSQLKNGL